MENLGDKVIFRVDSSLSDQELTVAALGVDWIMFDNGAFVRQVEVVSKVWVYLERPTDFLQDAEFLLRERDAVRLESTGENIPIDEISVRENAVGNLKLVQSKYRVEATQLAPALMPAQSG